LDLIEPMHSTETGWTKTENTKSVDPAFDRFDTKSWRTPNDTENKESNAIQSNLQPNPANDTSNVVAVDSEDVVVIRGDEAFLWKGAQSRLCKHIKEARKEQKSQKTLRLYLQVPCGIIDQQNTHGNIVIGLYGMKLAAIAFGAEFTFRCEERERKESLLWWLQSKTDPSETDTNRLFVNNNALYDPPLPTTDLACRGFGRAPLHYTSEYVRHDFRAMATELAPSMNSKGIVIDEVAIHFRCGDTLSDSMSPEDTNYGLVQFQAYRKRIPPSADSIGIVTAPFSDTDRRKQDWGSGEMCRTLVSELVDYLRLHFPEARVRIRNDPSETIPEVMTRLILAKHNFCVRSSFCALPSMASYGTSYVQKRGTSCFVEDASGFYEDLQLMDEPFLLTREIHERGFNSTLRWLTES